MHKNQVYKLKYLKKKILFSEKENVRSQKIVV